MFVQQIFTSHVLWANTVSSAGITVALAVNSLGTSSGAKTPRKDAS